MAREKHWDQFGPLFLTSNGTSDGIVEVSDTCGAYVKQKIVLKSNTQERVDLEIKRVLNSTQIQLGPAGQNINTFSDLSLFTNVDSAFILANPQSINHVPPADITQALYDREPIVAMRNILVDCYGDYYRTDNPLPVRLSDGSVNIGSVNAELEVQLSHVDNNPDSGDVADSVQVGDGVEILQINPDGSINTLNSEGVSSFQVRTDTINNITYKGIADPGSSPSDPVWKISRTVKYYNNTTGLEDEVTLVAGTGVFDQIWDNRASLFPAETPIDFTNRRFERLLPILANANWMKLGDFDRVAPAFSDSEVTMKYYQSGANIGDAVVRYINELDWEINLYRYINDSNGDILLDDDDSPLLLD